MVREKKLPRPGSKHLHNHRSIWRKLSETRILIFVTIAIVGGIYGVFSAVAAPVACTAMCAIAPTPPMGWNGYNHFGTSVTGATVKRETQALVSSGMAAAGYTYVNLDGGWDMLQRNSKGQLVANPAKFPDGIKALANYVHSKGLKFGIYTSAGRTNCAGTSAGSYGHYQQDAKTFASWGVDYLKFDYCNVPGTTTRGTIPDSIAEGDAQRMARALKATGRPIFFDVNDANVNNGNDHNHDWQWAPKFANMWRVTHDISASYTQMVRHILGVQGLPSNESYDLALHGYAKPGGWNDPDMLEVGNGTMSTTVSRAEFSLWAEEAAPLIAGNDLASMSTATKQILTNSEVIAIDQDPLGEQGHLVSRSSGHWILAKPLLGGSDAVLLFNNTSTSAVIRTTTTQIGLKSRPSYILRNVWTHTSSKTKGTVAAVVPSHGVVMYKVEL